jgi:hypothetical protein
MLAIAGDFRKRTERQQRRGEQQIERLVEQQHDRRLPSFDRPSAPTIELIEGPAPTEDSSDPARSSRIESGPKPSAAPLPGQRSEVCRAPMPDPSDERPNMDYRAWTMESGRGAVEAGVGRRDSLRVSARRSAVVLDVSTQHVKSIVPHAVRLIRPRWSWCPRRWRAGAAHAARHRARRAGL